MIPSKSFQNPLFFSISPHDPEYEDITSIFNNNARINEYINLARDAKKGYLSDLAYFISMYLTKKRETDTGELIRLIAEIVNDDMRKAIETEDFVFFCREIIKFTNKKITLSDFFGKGEKVPESALGKVSYIKNAYAESAIKHLTPITGKLIGIHAHSPAALCEDLYNGSCEYSMLPIENSENGKLFSFSELIRKYDLKIFASCDISSENLNRFSAGSELDRNMSNDKTRFVLLRKNLPTEIPANNDTPELLFEFYISGNGNRRIETLFEAARMFGLKLRRVDSSPIQYVDDEFSFDCIFKTDRNNIIAFLLYLSLDFPQYIPVGLYVNI